eukprot:jgi/Chrpa1/23577/Chrysochromulina_OHIO_Genome00027205-RA
MVRNAVLDRAGQPTEPPPPPLSVAARMRALEKSHDPELDDTMWQWRQRKWVHLPPPSKKPTRESFTMRSRRTPYAVSANTLGPGGVALPRLLGCGESPPLQKSPPKPSSPLTAVEKRETPQKLKMPPPPPTQSPSELKVAPGRLSRGASALSALTISTLNTLDEVRIISSFDKLMDKDHNGGLDFEELKAVLRSLNSALTNDELHAIFRECDPNGDGIVTISEFLRVRRGGLKKTNPSFAAPPGADPEAPPAPPASPPKPILSDEQVHSIKQWTPYAAGAAALIALVIIIGSSVTSYAAAVAARPAAPPPPPPLPPPPPAPLPPPSPPPLLLKPPPPPPLSLKPPPPPPLSLKPPPPPPLSLKPPPPPPLSLKPPPPPPLLLKPPPPPPKPPLSLKPPPKPPLSLKPPPKPSPPPPQSPPLRSPRPPPPPSLPPSPKPPPPPLPPPPKPPPPPMPPSQPGALAIVGFWMAQELDMALVVLVDFVSSPLVLTLAGLSLLLYAF